MMKKLAELITKLKENVEAGELSPNQVVEELETIYDELDDIDTDIYNLIQSGTDADTAEDLEEIRKRIGI
jgi:hypothetical protein